MQWLPFMSNQDFIDVLSDIKNRADEAKVKAKKQFSRNTIDPFAALFQMELLSIDANRWQSVEEHRQVEKSLQNHIGEFHQKLISTFSGWETTHKDNVIDVIHEKRQIIAEIKNKHNTIKGSDLHGVRQKLRDLVRKKGQKTQGYTAYLVEIIPKKKERYDVPFVTSDHTSGQPSEADELVRRVDGATFYEIATGDPDALRKVFKAIPLGLKELGINIDQEKMNLAKTYFDKAISD